MSMLTDSNLVNVPKFTQPQYLRWKNLHPKEGKFCQNLNWQNIIWIYTKSTIFFYYKIPYKKLVSTLLKLKNSFLPFISLNFYTKRARKWDKKNLQQNTVCSEQQIYASQENFTQLLVVMVENIIRSAQIQWFFGTLYSESKGISSKNI